MPEGDTVWRQAQQLDLVLRGKELLRSDFRVPAYATVDLAGYRVENVKARGKHLLIECNSPAGNTVLIHSHLKMEGSWHTYSRQETWRRPIYTARVILEAAEAVAVRFSLGFVHVLKPDELDLDYLGPDLLGPDWNPAEARKRLSAQLGRPIGLALLDQRNLAGIGNIYRNELCFLIGAHPLSAVEKVDLDRVIELAKRLLEANKNRKQRSTTGGPARADNASWVYGRVRQPCRRCGSLIREDELEGRVIYFCPRCQPLAN